MRAVSQRPTGLLDSNHPAVEVFASCRSVATHTCFAEPSVSNVVVDSREGLKHVKEGRGRTRYNPSHGSW